MSKFTHTIPPELVRYARNVFQGSDIQKVLRSEIDEVIDEFQRVLETVPPDRLQGVQESLKTARRIREILHAHDTHDTREFYAGRTGN